MRVVRVGIVDAHRRHRGWRLLTTQAQHHRAIAKPHLGVDDPAVGPGNLRGRAEAEAALEPGDRLLAPVVQVGIDTRLTLAGRHVVGAEAPQSPGEVARRVIARAVVGVVDRHRDLDARSTGACVVSVDLRNGDVDAIAHAGPRILRSGHPGGADRDEPAAKPQLGVADSAAVPRVLDLHLEAEHTDQPVDAVAGIGISEDGEDVWFHAGSVRRE